MVGGIGIFRVYIEVKKFASNLSAPSDKQLETPERKCPESIPHIQKGIMKKMLLLFLGCLASAHVGAQGIIHSTFNYYLPPTSWDIDGDGQMDFSVTWSGAFIGTTDVPQSFASTFWTLTAASGGSFNANIGTLAAGTIINSTSGFWSENGASATLSSLLIHPLENKQDWTGVLSPDSSGLVAIRFLAADGFFHYGWILFRMAAAPTELIDGTPIEFGPQIVEFAWNTTPDEFIVAGQIPEPSVVTLLAIGLSALCLDRHFRFRSPQTFSSATNSKIPCNGIFTQLGRLFSS